MNETLANENERELPRTSRRVAPRNWFRKPLLYPLSYGVSRVYGRGCGLAANGGNKTASQGLTRGARGVTASPAAPRGRS